MTTPLRAAVPLHLLGVTPTQAFHLTDETDFRWLADFFSGYHGVPGLRAALAADTAPLDAAWAEAEAALPKGWRFSIAPYYPSGWEAEAHDITRPYTPGRNKNSTGTTGAFDTPAAALRALAARLADNHS